MNNCPECGSKNIILDYQHGDLLCNNCGLILDELYLYQGDEWISNDSDVDDHKVRTGPPENPRVFDKGLATEIDNKNRDSYGKPISNENRSQLYRLRKWQKRLRASNALEKNLKKAYQEIDRIGSVLGLSNKMREEACHLYKKAVKKNLIRGRSINCIASSCIYTTCRQFGNPRTMEEISDVTLLDKRDIGRTYRFLCRELELKIKPTKSQEYIERYCNELDLNVDVIKSAKEILNDAETEEILSGKSPSGLAAAAIYIAAKNKKFKITQEKIANVSSVTEVTIRNRYKEIVEKLDMQPIF